MPLVRRYRRSPGEDNPYWMSFTDMMSALLVVFILAALILILELLETRSSVTEAIADLDRADQVRRDILVETHDKLKELGIRVEIHENHSVLRIPNELLGFETNEYELQEHYESTARAIGEVLGAALVQGDRLDYINTVFLEGHTDHRPIRGGGIEGTGNWGLSALRAIKVWEFWRDELSDELDLASLTNQDGEKLFSVSGYGPTRPVTEHQETEQELAENRRLDLRIIIRRPEVRDYEEVHRMLGGSQ